MQNRNPLASLIALAAAAAMLAPAHAAKPEPAPQPEAPSLDELLNEIFGAGPAPTPQPFDLNALLQEVAPRGKPTPGPIAQVCTIPQDIADRAGMNDAGFDPHSLEGRTVALLAAALANLRELKEQSNPANQAKCVIADRGIGMAVAALDIIANEKTANS